jgi:hypothetical protein
MVALTTAAVIQDRRAAMGVADRRAALGDLADGHVPVDLFEAAVRAPPERCGQAVATVLIVIQPHRLVARVSRHTKVRLVAADSSESPTV